MKTTVFKEIEESLNGALTWLKHLGVRVHSTRIDLYRKSLSSLLDIRREKNYAEASNRFPEFANVLLEIEELIVIYHGLRSFNKPDDLVPRLKEIVSGPFCYKEEGASSGNRARNIAFELNLASKIFDCGMGIKLNNIADIVTEFEGQKIYIECKRPQSISKIETNLKKANSQLKNRYESSVTTRTRGIIGIDISKIQNPNWKLLTYSDEQDISNWLNSAIDIFSNNHLQNVGGKMHKKTLAAIIRISILAVPKGDGNITYCQKYGYHIFDSPGSLNHLAAVGIGKTIEKNKRTGTV